MSQNPSTGRSVAAHYQLLVGLGLTLLSLVLHIIAMATPSLYSQVLVKTPDYEVGLWMTCAGGTCENTASLFTTMYPRCAEIADNIKTAEAFSILYTLVAFAALVLLLDALSGIIGHLDRRFPSLLVVMSLVAFVFEMITMSVVSATQREKYCNSSVHLYDVFKLSYGWAFFFLAFLFHFVVLCLALRVYWVQ